MMIDSDAIAPVLGFYSIGLRPPTEQALLTFAQQNSVPALDIRAGAKGLNLLGLEPDAARETLNNLRRAAPIRMLATDVDLGDLIDDPEPALAMLWQLHDLLDRDDACALRILARRAPTADEVVSEPFAATVARLPLRPLLLELHNPDWFRFPVGQGPVASFEIGSRDGLAVFELLIDSHQMAQADAEYETSHVTAILKRVSSRIGMVHLCNPGTGLNANALRLIAEVLDDCDAVPIGFEFTGPDRRAAKAAQAYRAACRDWNEARVRVVRTRLQPDATDAAGVRGQHQERSVS